MEQKKRLTKKELQLLATLDRFVDYIKEGVLDGNFDPSSTTEQVLTGSLETFFAHEAENE